MFRKAITTNLTGIDSRHVICTENMTEKNVLRYMYIFKDCAHLKFLLNVNYDLPF